jgi:hypothetical protein
LSPVTKAAGADVGDELDLRIWHAKREAGGSRHDRRQHDAVVGAAEQIDA